MCAKNQAPITIFTKVGARQKFGNFRQKPGFPATGDFVAHKNVIFKNCFSFIFKL